MKKLILSLVIVIFVTHLFAQSFVPADNGSEVKFIIKNFGLNVAGSFKGLTGKVVFNPAMLTTAAISASVSAATINTGNELRDDHLRNETYFDVANFPLIGFTSSRITHSPKPGVLLMEGNITIKGITKKVSFPFTATSLGAGYLFTGEFEINRRDFGVGTKSMVMSDNLKVLLSVLTKVN